LCAAASAPLDPHLKKQVVELPASSSLFPEGEGASIANSQCLVCHSTEMVLFQPRRTEAQWRETINKMRNVYGAAIPVDQTDPLAAYLTSVVAREPAGLASRPQSSAVQEKHASSDGAAIFAGQCAACHQSSGAGLPGAFPPLARSDWVAGGPDALIQILLHGVQGTLTVNGTRYNGAMPALGANLSDADIAAVLSYIRGSWGNKAAPVEESRVKAQRMATSGRTAPWSGDTELAKLKQVH